MASEAIPLESGAPPSALHDDADCAVYVEEHFLHAYSSAVVCHQCFVVPSSQCSLEGRKTMRVCWLQKPR